MLKFQLFFFFFALDLKTEYFLFQVNSPNLNPKFHILIRLITHLLPVYIITSRLKNVKGITELRVRIRFSDV